MKRTVISSTPLDEADIAALDAAFGGGRKILGITPEQKAEQDGKLTPFMRNSVTGHAHQAAEDRKVRR